MLATPMDILTQFPVRNTREQKRAFRDAVLSYAQRHDYPARIEKTAFSGEVLIVGDPEQAGILIAAGNVSGDIITLLEILRTLPENRRDRVCFLLYSGFLTELCANARRYKPSLNKKLVLVLQNAASGNKLRMIPTNVLKENRRKLTSLYKACGYFGDRSLIVQEEKTLPWYFPFACGASICAMQPGKKETYSCRIKEESQDPDLNNIHILRAALTTYICCEQPQ